MDDAREFSGIADVEVPVHSVAKPSGQASALAGFATQDAYVGSGSLAAAYAVEVDPALAREAVDPFAAARKIEKALTRDLSVAELTRLRRRFAAQHHPDRVPPELRPAAQVAMADINARIDQALAVARQRK